MNARDFQTSYSEAYIRYLQREIELRAARRLARSTEAWTAYDTHVRTQPPEALILLQRWLERKRFLYEAVKGTYEESQYRAVEDKYFRAWRVFELFDKELSRIADVPSILDSQGDDVVTCDDRQLRLL